MPLAGILWLLTFEQAKESNSPRGEKEHYIRRTASEYALRALATVQAAIHNDVGFSVTFLISIESDYVDSLLD